MPLAVNKRIKRENMGQSYVNYVELNLGVYATNGVSWTPLLAALGLSQSDITWIDVSPTATHRFRVDYANKKILAYVAATEAEVANGVDITAQVARAEIVGT